MYYLFPVDSVLRDPSEPFDSVDKSNLCLSSNQDTAKRQLRLHYAAAPSEIISDVKEAGLNGLACVGIDGTCISPDEIRSERYAELIKACHNAGLLFIHGFPFADTYGNQLSKTYPHIVQKYKDGSNPSVGWDQVNGHPNIDYGSNEFIEFCRKSIDALADLGVTIIDYAEPDHFPGRENGYGQSLVEAWKEFTGSGDFDPQTIEYRRFMEDRNIRGLNEIGSYAHAKGLADHLTASPLMHCSATICQNYGKYSHTRITELSNTFHSSYGSFISDLMSSVFGMPVPASRCDGLGFIESKSMRDWSERHAVYFGCGQSLPFNRMRQHLASLVILHQMDFFCWDYTNFRYDSMYRGEPMLEDPEKKWQKIKSLLHNTIDTYMSLPEDYRNAVVSPDALVFYSKVSDYTCEYVDPDISRLSGGLSLYATCLKLQSSDVPFMMAFDEYPDVLSRDGKDVPVLIIDGCQQQISDRFTKGVGEWFTPGKAVFFSGNLDQNAADLMESLASGLTIDQTQQAQAISGFRSADYSNTVSCLKFDDWNVIYKWNDNPVIYSKGNAKTGIVIYSLVPAFQLYNEDVRILISYILRQLERNEVSIQGSIQREVVRYRNGSKTFIAIKSNDTCDGMLTLTSEKAPQGIYLRSDESFSSESDGKYRLTLNFNLDEVRIIEYP